MSTDRREPPPPAEVVRVAFVTALRHEAAAIERYFDERWRWSGRELPYLQRHKPKQFHRNFVDSITVAMLESHCVVLTQIEDKGKDAAIMTAAQLFNVFHNIERVLVVGILAAAPARRNEIRLGDVIISEAIVPYDSGTKEETGWVLSPVIKPGNLPFLNTLKGSRNEKLLLHAHTYLEEKISTAPTLTPRLAVPSYYWTKGPGVQFGPIASGNIVVKDEAYFKEIQTRCPEDIIGLEMEAAGVAKVFKDLVITIKGVSDYADRDKNDDVQQYAAYAAAAVAMAFIFLEYDSSESLSAEPHPQSHQFDVQPPSPLPGPCSHRGSVGAQSAKSVPEPLSHQKKPKRFRSARIWSKHFTKEPDPSLQRSFTFPPTVPTDTISPVPYCSDMTPRRSVTTSEPMYRSRLSIGGGNNPPESPTSSTASGNGNDEQKYLELEIVEACQLHHYRAIHRMVESGEVDVNAFSTCGKTMLHIVIGKTVQTQKSIQLDINDSVIYLCGKGANVNAATVGEGWTPLHYCARSMNLEAAKLLLYHRPDVNAQDKKMRTPLDVLVRNNKPDMEFVEFLIYNGARIGPGSTRELMVSQNCHQSKARIRAIAFGELRVRPP